jgi:hypothetical protein
MQKILIKSKRIYNCKTVDMYTFYRSIFAELTGSDAVRKWFKGSLSYTADLTVSRFFWHMCNHVEDFYFDVPVSNNKPRKMKLPIGKDFFMSNTGTCFTITALDDGNAQDLNVTKYSVYKSVQKLRATEGWLKRDEGILYTSARHEKPDTEIPNLKLIFNFNYLISLT